tara:strand:- start:306 stop:764 length:459 start_codon:yes stop_codon:yes gene_type:complete
MSKKPSANKLSANKLSANPLDLSLFDDIDAIDDIGIPPPTPEDDFASMIHAAKLWHPGDDPDVSKFTDDAGKVKSATYEDLPDNSDWKTKSPDLANLFGTRSEFQPVDYNKYKILPTQYVKPSGGKKRKTNKQTRKSRKGRKSSKRPRKHRK